MSGGNMTKKQAIKKLEAILDRFNQRIDEIIDKKNKEQ